jgi:hypothetical protein
VKEARFIYGSRYYVTSATSSLSQRMGGDGLSTDFMGGLVLVSSNTRLTRLSRHSTEDRRGKPVSSHLHDTHNMSIGDENEPLTPLKTFTKILKTLTKQFVAFFPIDNVIF